MPTGVAEAAFSAWGWRIPFLIKRGVDPGRTAHPARIEESADFERVRAAGQVEKLPVVQVFRRTPLQVLVGSVASIAAPTLGYLVSVYMVSYGTNTLELPTTTMLWTLVGVSVLWNGIMLAAGLAGDVLGRKPTFLIGAALSVVWAFPMFWLVDTGSLFWIFVALVVITAANSIMAGPQPALVTEMFPVRLRYSGSSICYQIGSIIGGGVAPILATTLFAKFGNPAVSTLIVVISLLSLFAILFAGQRILQAQEPTAPQAQQSRLQPLAE